MTEDRIKWTTPVKDEAGRLELHFANLTKTEAIAMLLTLDKLQTDRKTMLYMDDKLDIGAASKPERAARDYAIEVGEPDPTLPTED